MKQLLLTTLLFFSFFSSVLAQPPIAWQKCFEWSGNPEGFGMDILQTTDGGFIASCITSANNGDITGNHGGLDFWILKLDNTGNVQWKKCFGGSGNEIGTIALTSDGGYILHGITNSNDGDVSGNHGGVDVWLVKLNSTGNVQWKKCYGGSGNDEGYVFQTTDGGYILHGETTSNDGDVSGNHGGSDIWLLKLDANGAKQWQKCYGGIGNEQLGIPNLFLQTTDSGYLLSASTFGPNDGDVTGFHGGEDAWILKVNNNGNIQWQKCLGGSGYEYNDLGKILETSDGGCIVGRYHTTSMDGDVSGNHGSGDSWVVKLSNTGTIQWQKSLGGTKDDFFTNLFHSNDGGYFVFNRTSSIDGDVLGNHGGSDIWAVKLNNNGTIEWQKCFGGSDYEEEGPKSFRQTSDGGFILSISTSSTDGDVVGNHGEGDIWVVKLDNNGLIQWQKCLGGTDSELGLLSETSDGFIAAGLTYSNDGDITCQTGLVSIWIVKLGSVNATDEKENDREWKVYPNPTPDYLTISSNKAEGKYDFRISDALGRIVFVRSGLHLNQREPLDLSKLADGIYYYKIQSENDVINVGKVVKADK